MGRHEGVGEVKVTSRRLYVLLIFLSFAGLLFSLWQLAHSPPKRESVLAETYFPGEANSCSLSPPSSDLDEEYLYLLPVCDSFQFNAKEGTFQFLGGPRKKDWSIILTEFTLTPASQDGPQCWIDRELVPAEFRYDAPQGIYFRQLTDEEHRMLINLSLRENQSPYTSFMRSQWINVTLACTEFDEKDVEEEVWIVNYSIYFIPRRDVLGILAGNLSGNYRGHGQVVISQSLAREIEDKVKSLQVELNRPERMRYLFTYSGLAVASLIILAYSTWNLVRFQKK